MNISDVRVAVITVLDSELEAVKMVLAPIAKAVHQVSSRVYYLCAIPSLQGAAHKVAITQLDRMGNDNAQLMVTQIREDCPLLQCVIFCGIAGAAPNPKSGAEHVRLGDIVVGTEGIVPYKDGKERDREFEVRARLLQHSTGDRLVAAAKRLRQGESGDRRRPWDSYIHRLVDSISESSRPQESDILVEAVRLPLVGRLPWLTRKFPHPFDPIRQSLGGMPRVFYGVVASANVVQSNSETRDRIRDLFKARCFEMEGFGVQFSAAHFQLDCLVVRGTCDYCNARKNSRFEAQWQRYAANIAAAYVRALLEELPNTLSHPVRAMHNLVQRLVASGPGSRFAENDASALRELLPQVQALVGWVPGQGGAGPSGASLTGLAGSFELEVPQVLVKLRALQDAFAYDELFTLADQLSEQLRLRGYQLTSALRRSAYFRLGGIEVIRQELESVKVGGNPDLAKALEFLEKANAA